MFEITQDNRSVAGKNRIVLRGEIDISTASEFKAKLHELIGDGTTDVELLCEDLSYIDSAGLGILVGALKKVKNHQRNVYIYYLRDNIKKLFKITGLDKIFILEEAT